VRHFELTRFVYRKSVTATKPTPRELEVEDLLCRGYSQENIAAIFGRSVKTISVQARSLYRKRGVHTQVGLLLAYLERKHIYVFGDDANRSVSTGCMPLETAQ
jgi:DNA-binding CsgD family transcriptional regulator